MIGDLLPVAQQRLGFEAILSQDGHVRLQQDIQQEAGQRYLQHTSSMSMPRLGQHPASHHDTTSGSNTVSQVDSFPIVMASRPVFLTHEAMQDNNDLPHSREMPESMTASSIGSARSPPSTHTPATDLSIHVDAQMQASQQSYTNAQTDSSLRTKDELGDTRGAMTQTFEDSSQLSLDPSNEHFRDPFDPVANLDFDWEAEINAIMV